MLLHVMTEVLEILFYKSDVIWQPYRLSIFTSIGIYDYYHNCKD